MGVNKYIDEILADMSYNDERFLKIYGGIHYGFNQGI